MESNTQCGISFHKSALQIMQRKRKRVRNRELKKDSIIDGRKTESLKVRDGRKEREREETEKYEKSREVHLFSKCPKEEVAVKRGGEGPTTRDQ